MCPVYHVIFMIPFSFDEIVSDDDVIFDVEMLVLDSGRTLSQFSLRKIVITLDVFPFE